jgi:hypothetical protein
MVAVPSARNITVQLGEWEEEAFGLIRMSRKEIFMMHNVVLGASSTEKAE